MGNNDIRRLRRIAATQDAGGFAAAIQRSFPDPLSPQDRYVGRVFGLGSGVTVDAPIFVDTHPVRLSADETGAGGVLTPTVDTDPANKVVVAITRGKATDDDYVIACLKDGYWVAEDEPSGNPCGGCFSPQAATIAVTYWGYLGVAYGYGSGCGLITTTGTMNYGTLGDPLCSGPIHWGIAPLSAPRRIDPYGLSLLGIGDQIFRHHYFCMYCDNGNIILFHRMQTNAAVNIDAGVNGRIDTWTEGHIDSCDPWVVTFDDPPYLAKYYTPTIGPGEVAPYEVCYCDFPGGTPCTSAGIPGIYGFPDSFPNPFGIHSVVITGP